MVLDVLLQRRRNQEAAEALLHRLLEGQLTQPRMIVTDRLASYAPAIRKLFPQAEHRAHKGLNNRAENSHQPTRQRERARRRFKTPEHTQRFLELFGPIRQHFCPGRHRLAAQTFRVILKERFACWDELTGITARSRRQYRRRRRSWLSSTSSSYVTVTVPSTWGDDLRVETHKGSDPVVAGCMTMPLRVLRQPQHCASRNGSEVALRLHQLG
jgi:hypothetical protein